MADRHSQEKRKVVYRTCQLCAQALRIRVDGKFPVHRTPRELLPVDHRLKPATCMGSEVTP